MILNMCSVCSGVICVADCQNESNKLCLPVEFLDLCGCSVCSGDRFFAMLPDSDFNTVVDPFNSMKFCIVQTMSNVELTF